MNLNEAKENIGKKVVYKLFTPDKISDWHGICGVITSVNDNFVFVRYGTDVNSKATNANDLEFDM